MSDLPSVDRARISTVEAQRALENPDLEAFTLLVAALSVVGEEVIAEDDEQPMDAAALRLVLAAENINAPEEVIQKVCGLTFAISGEEFLEDPDHFERFSSAIVFGDPFAVEEEEEEFDSGDAWWALYMAGLLIEDNFIPDLGEGVKHLLERLSSFDIEDVEEKDFAFLNGDADDDDTPGPVEKLLNVRLGKLARELAQLGVKPEWLSELDEELANRVAAI